MSPQQTPHSKLWDPKNGPVGYVCSGTVCCDGCTSKKSEITGYGKELRTCDACHGQDGRTVNFDSPESPVYIGTLANDNPWEFLHKVRFAHPGSPMPSFELLGWPAQFAADTGAHAATLPQ